MSRVHRLFRCLLMLVAVGCGLSAGEGTGTGLSAAYFANETLSGTPAVTRVDAQVNFVWSGGAPASGMPVDSFSARWDGEIEARFTENLTLIARTDDGVRLWLDGQLVIDQWVLRGAADSSYTLAAVAGRKYRIRLEYYEHFGSAVAQLLWQSASIPRAAIPSAWLYPTPATEPPAGTGTGLLARYYANETLSGTPVLARTDARVDFGWGGGSPDGSVPVESFSARWDGEIEARVSEPLTIIARTDDGVRVWINGQVVIDAWVLRSAADSTYTFSAEAGQRYRIRMEYYEHTGAAVARLWWQSANEPKGPIPTSQLYPTDPVDPPNGTGTGLLASYFVNETLSGTPVLSRTEARVDHSWGSGSPGAGVPVDVFSARWLGEIEPRVSEALTIIARTDDGVRLWIDGQLVIDQWILRGAADSTYTFSAEAGRRYSIRMEYFEHLGSAVAKLWWQSASEPKAPIPTSQLYPTEPAIPPAGTGTGLFATYFANETLSGDPILSRVEARIDHSWGSGSPGSPVPVDVFSARWEGEIEPRVSEPLTIIARTDDGVRVWLNDAPVIDAWILRGAADSTYTFTAVAGQRYRIRMEYFEHFGSAVAKLWWQSANEPKGPIPTSQLYPITGTPTTPTIAFASAGATVAETVGSTPVAVTLSQPAATDVTVTIQSTGGGATAPATITITAGGTTASVPVTISDDPRFGPDRQVTLSLVNPVGADLGLVTSHVLTIQNTDAAPTIAFTAPTSFNLEQSGTASVIVRLSAVSAQMTSVTVGLTGTAEAGSDYQAPSATLQIPADTFEGTIFIPLLADSTPEQDETIIVTLSAPVGATLSNPSVHTITLSDGNLAPVIANGPTPAVNPVTGTSVSLSFVATDDGGAANLSFTWSTVGSVPAPVSFSPATGSVETSSTTTATFSAPGTYPIQIQVRDAYDLTATAQTTITVQSTPMLITVAPATATVSVLGTQSFTATGVNQFGAALAQPLPVTWSVAGGGSIATNGVFTAGTTAGGPFTVTATLPTAQGVAAVTVIDNAPTLVQGPTATVNAAGTGLILSALATDDGGEGALTYRWSIDGSAPGIVSFAANDSNAAKSTTATVSAAGTYTLRLTVTDAAGQATPITTPVTVAQRLSALAIAPDTVSLTTGAEFDFTLTGRDQFDAVMTGISSPMWSITGGGTITPTATGAHLVAGSEAGGPFTLTVVSGVTQATATVTIVPPTGQAQTISFAPLPAKTFGDAAFTLTATASSGLPVSFNSSDTSVATITGTMVTIVGAGTTNITAAQDGDATWDPATPVVQPLTVAKAAQTITFAALTARTVGDAPFALTATASSGLPVSYTSSHSDVATITGDQVTILAAGTTTITAIQAGGPNHLPAEPVLQALTITKASQTITFAAVPAKTYGDAPFLLTATASSGLPVALASSDTSVATIQDGTITIHAAGTTIFTATQSGDATWDAAAQVQQTLTVNKAAQTITFAALSSYTVGDLPFALTATTSSGLPVTFTSSTPAVASVSGDTVTIVAAGTTIITAEQAGNGNYLAAAPVAQPLTIAPPPKQTQTITFAALPAKTYGDAPFALTATASSGLPVSYTSSDTSVATISGNTVTIVGAGNASIMASQSGDATWEAATSVVQPLMVAKQTQTITFGALPSHTYSDPAFTLTATASSGLQVSFTSSDPAIAAIDGALVTILKGGTVTITASQAGDTQWDAAPSVPQALIIAKASQTITFTALSMKSVGDPVVLSASATSGLSVTFTSSNSTVATVSGSTLNLIGVGTALITASQAGDDRYLPAADVIREQVVEPAKLDQYISFDAYYYNLKVGDPPIELQAYSFVWGIMYVDIGNGEQYAYPYPEPIGLPITYISSNPAVASVSGNILTLHSPGIVTITATQPGNATYKAAEPVAQELIIRGSGTTPQTITFPSIPSVVYGQNVTVPLTATASSGLPITYVSNSSGIVIEGESFRILNAGYVSITAMQLGNAEYQAANEVTQYFQITQAPQTITFEALTNKPANAQPFALTATSSSGLVVSYVSSDPAVASVSGNMVTVLKSGTTTITARQSGSGNYLPATPVDQTLTVERLEQTIAFTTVPALTLGSAPVMLQATTDSGLPITITSSDSSVAVVRDTTLYLIRAGSAVLTAAQAGDEIHAPAQATQSITIQPATAPEPGTPVDWQADLAVDVDFSASQTGSDPEALEDVKYHYSKDDTIQVFIAGRSASGAYIDRIVVTLGDQQDEITGPSGMAEFPGLAEGEYDLSVQISAHHGEDAGAKSFERFGQADEPYRMSVDRTKPVLTLLLPKRFWLDADDREPGRTEFPLVRNEPPRFWVNREAESWNKSLRTKYSRETFGQTDLGNGVIAAVADVTGVDKRITAQVATGRTIAGNATSRPLTLSVLDKDSTDEDRPDPEQASTDYRLLIKGISTLPDSRPGSGTENGDYRMRLTVKDKAGNKVDDVEFIMITVDTASPSLNDVTSFTSPFRFFDGADEDCQLAWQGTEATDQTLMRSRWSQPIGTGRSLGGWRLNQPIPTAAPSLFKAGYPYAWASATGNFIVADAAGNRTSGQVTFNAMTSGANFASYVTPMPSGSFDRTRAQGDTFVDYRPEQENPIDQQAFPWSDDDDEGPRAYTFPTQSGIWALLGRIQDTSPEEEEEGHYSWDWSFRRFISFEDFRTQIMEVTDPESDDYPDPLDRLGATSVTPLDPQVSQGNADDLYMRPAIITIAPSWKPKATLGDSDRVRIAVTEKPDGYPFSTGLITVGATNDPADEPGAQSYSGGLSRMFLPARENVTSGFSNVGYAYLASGEGSGSSGGAAPAPLFYDQEPVTISSYSLLGGALNGDVDYGNFTAYWLNAIRLSPDVVATGGVRTIRISAGFFTDQYRADLFSKTGDYVHFRTQDEQDLTVRASDYASASPESLKGKIAIVSQRMVYPDGNVWQRQQLELTLAIGADVPASLCHVDVKLGAVKAYSDELSAAYAGANGAHRMKEALAVYKAELIDQDDTAYPLLAPISDPHPVITLNSVTVSPREDATADVVITGTVEDAVADFATGSRPTEVRFLEYTAPITADGAPESDPIWKPRAWRGRFELQFNRLLMQDDIIGNVTAVNALGNEGSARVVINAKFRIEGPDHGVPATSYDDIRAPVATLLAQPKAGAISTLSLSLDKVTYVTMSEEAAGSGVLTGVLPDETTWRWTVAELMVSETIAADTLLPLPAKLSGELVIQQPASVPVALQLDLTLLSGLNYATIVHVVGGDEEAGNTARVILETANGTIGKSSKSGVVKPLRLRRQMPTEMTVPSQEFHFAGMPFRWEADPSDPTVWLSDKAVLLTQLSGANEPQVVDVTKPADLRVVADDKTAAEMYASLIMSDDPHDTITVGTGLTVKVRAVVAGWIPTEAEQALTTGTWKLKAHAGTGGADIPLNDVEEDRSERRDARTWLGFGRVERKTVYTFKAAIPKSQSVGMYDLVWTDASGKEHPPIQEQVRVVHPMVIMLCMDGINGDLFKEALQEAQDDYPGSGLNQIFGNARTSGRNNGMPNHQWFSPSATATAINSLPTITWCNWATIFTGKEPKDHGILGNSFFRREVQSSRPLFSGNAESDYDSQADHRNAAVYGLSPLLYPGTVTIFQNFTAMDASREAVSIHAWYPNAKSGTEFNGTQQGEYGQANVGADNLRCVRYLLPGWAGWSVIQGEVIPSLQALHHNEEGAKEADQVSGERALELLTDANNLPSLLAIYFPGPDNIGHAKGRVSDTNGDGTTSLAATKDFLMNGVIGTDAQLKLLYKRVKKLGAQNAVIWLAVSDHGLMGTNRDKHPHPRPLTAPPGSFSANTDNPITGGLFSLRDGMRYQTASLGAGSGPNIQINLKTQYRSEMEVFFRRVLEQNPDDFAQDQTTSTVWYDRPIPRGDGMFIPALEALWAPQLPVPVSAIYSPDGGLAHIYVRERTGGSNWNQVSGGVAGNDTRQLAWYLAKESLGDFSQFPGGKPLMPKDVNDPSKGSQFQGGLAFEDGDATVAGVFVLVGTKYQRAVPLDGFGEVNLVDVNDSMTGGASWKILKTRLDEMARQTGVSRSGDIVLIFNIRGSYATVNDATEEELNGWHGSPTQAESVTPLVYATPGYGWYQSDNSSLPTSAQSTSSSEGKYRNSDVRGSLEKLIKSVTGR